MTVDHVVDVIDLDSGVQKRDQATPVDLTRHSGSLSVVVTWEGDIGLLDD